MGQIYHEKSFALKRCIVCLLPPFEKRFYFGTHERSSVCVYRELCRASFSKVENEEKNRMLRRKCCVQVG